MIIRVSEIPEEGLDLQGPESLSHPFSDPTWSLEALSLRLEKDGDVVSVQGSLQARVPLVCGRCLEPFQITLDPAVDVRCVPSPQGRGEERELGADDLETAVYDGDALDLAQLVETETTLDLPMKPLCRADCRGLCPICGGNKNVTVCACEASAPDPRWAPLRNLAERMSR